MAESLTPPAPLTQSVNTGNGAQTNNILQTDDDDQKENSSPAPAIAPAQLDVKPKPLGGRRGRSGTIAARPDIKAATVSALEVMAEDELKPESASTSETQNNGDKSEDERDTFEDAPDTNPTENDVKHDTLAALEEEGDEAAEEPVVVKESAPAAEEVLEPDTFTEPTTEADKISVHEAAPEAKPEPILEHDTEPVKEQEHQDQPEDSDHVEAPSIAEDHGQAVASDPIAASEMSKEPLDGEATMEAEVPEVHNATQGNDDEPPVVPELSHAHTPHIETTAMDDVNLGETDAAVPTSPTEHAESRPQSDVFAATPSLPPIEAPHEHIAEEPMKGLSGDLPAVNYPPPPPPPEVKPLPVPPPPVARKVSSPFSWFSRSKTMKPQSPTRTTVSPSARRNTASSLATLGSNPDIEDGRDRSPGRPHRSSLKDRFHLLRLQEETQSAVAVHDGPEGMHQRGRSGSIQGLESGDKATLSPPPVLRSSSFSSVNLPTNEKLPPGTAAGTVQGPVEEQGPVNWDLWQAVVYEGPAAVARTSGEQLKSAIASGIPHPIRGVVWQVLADSKNDDLEIMYRELVVRGTDKEIQRPSPLPRTTSAVTLAEKESPASSASSIKSDTSTPATTVSPPPGGDVTSGEQRLSLEKKRRSKDEAAAVAKLEKTIKRDLGARTSYSKYLASAGLQDGLFGICKAYALFDEAVGYAQGMNFIAMPLLFNAPEEEAFSLFVRLMNKYNLRSLFTAEMTGLHQHLYQFERLLEDFEPALYCHLHRRGVTPTLYATQWFLTLFAYRFPLQLVLRVYDLIFSEGLSAILRFGIVLMQKNAQTLLEMKDMSQLSSFLKEKIFDVYIDKSPSASSILESGFFGSASGIDKEVYRADELVRDACAINISAETLATYAAEYEDKSRAERERETELENLRSSNTALNSRVRQLEERAQQHDIEHVGIASELVRTKVQNETLHDENESLSTQVAELRKMLEAAPGEVEDRLRKEMDRIMTRNIEVQNANRALEETVQDTEQELVGTKMMFAQLQAEHDGLKQKLSSIQSMLAEYK